MCELCRDKDKIVVDVDELKTNDLLVSGNRGLTLISEFGLRRIVVVLQYQTKQVPIVGGFS